MAQKSHRISGADFNKLVQRHRPNILAYAMMLNAGGQARDAVVLKTLAALWDRRKEYRPSESTDFCGWCYSQIADQIASQNTTDEAGAFVDQISSRAATFLPATDQRMESFDKAFFSLSAKAKKKLSISCQHHRLQDQYISKQKGGSRERFDREVEKLKLSLLGATVCAQAATGGAAFTVAEDSALLNYVTKTFEGQKDDEMKDMLLQNEQVQEQYFHHVALQEALMHRLVDEPSSQLREGEEFKSRKRPLVVVLLLLLLLLPLFIVGATNEGPVKDGVKAVTYSVIPEPSSVSMLAVGFSVLVMRRSRDDGGSK